MRNVRPNTSGPRRLISSCTFSHSCMFAMSHCTTDSPDSFSSFLACPKAYSISAVPFSPVTADQVHRHAGDILSRSDPIPARPCAAPRPSPAFSRSCDVGPLSDWSAFLPQSGSRKTGSEGERNTSLTDGMGSLGRAGLSHIDPVMRYSPWQHHTGRGCGVRHGWKAASRRHWRERSSQRGRRGTDRWIARTHA